MAKSPANNAAQRVRKKVRKNVSDGIAHVHASFNNTIIPLPIVKATLCLGRRLVVKVSRPRNPLFAARWLRSGWPLH